jgi:hypothetical protein
MKFTLILSILITSLASSYASHKSIAPQFRIHDLYALFSEYTHSGADVDVMTLEYNSKYDRYSHKKKTLKVPLSEFEIMQKIGQRVFKTNASDVENAQGSSFYVGGRLVLTNYHVFSPSFSSYLNCGSFSIVTNSSLEHKTLSCRKVIRCNRKLDYCLIDMQDKVKKKFFSRQVVKRWSLTSLEPLNFRATPNLGPQIVTRVIGNPQFKGIHTSKGFNIRYYAPNKRYIFYAPVFGGNSGGPLLNDAGEVIGIVAAQSPKIFGVDAYNLAVPMDMIWEDLKENISKKFLDQINY